MGEILVHGDNHFIVRGDGEISSAVTQLLKELAQGKCLSEPLPAAFSFGPPSLTGSNQDKDSQ